MFGNYLGISKDKKGAPGGSKFARTQQKASADTKCQKCMKLGHFTYECKGQREYKVRPTRTQILKDPRLRTKLTESAPPRTEDMPKEGTAAAILAANEAKRLAKAKRAASVSSSSGSSSGSSRSSSSGSGSDSGSGSGSESGSDSGSESEDDGRRRAKRSARRSRSRSVEDSKRRRDDRSEERDSSDRKGKGRAVERD